MINDEKRQREARDEAQKVYGLVTARIHHEDILLSQRTYNYLTLNVFLGAVFALNYGPEASFLPRLGGILAWVGFGFGVLQMLFGRRIERTITLWREYLWLIEEVAELRVDSVLFNFYRHARADTPYGTIVGREKAPRPMLSIFPWSITSSTNVVVGVFIPWLVCMLWLVVAVSATLRFPQGWIIIGVAGITVTCLAFFWPLPAYPRAERTAKHQMPSPHQKLPEAK